MKVIVLNITKYKENDAIIDCLSEHGIVSFLARGVLKPKAKFSFLNNPLTICDVVFVDGNYKYPIIKNCCLHHVVRKPNENLQYLICVLFLAKITKELLTNNSCSHILYNFLLNICEKLRSENSFCLCIQYAMKILELNGNGLSFDRCCVCSNADDLDKFSFSSGGKICKKCSKTINTKDFLDIKQEELLDKIIHNHKIDDYNSSVIIDLFKMIIAHLYNTYGVVVIPNDLLLCL